MPEPGRVLTREQVKRMLQLVGGDAETPEEKDAAWDALERSHELLARETLEEIAKLPSRMHPIAGYMFDVNVARIVSAVLSAGGEAP